MKTSRMPIGTVTRSVSNFKLYEARCADCEWTWAGGEEEAIQCLRGHAELQHPVPKPVFRQED